MPEDEEDEEGAGAPLCSVEGCPNDGEDFDRDPEAGLPRWSCGEHADGEATKVGTAAGGGG